MSDSLHRFAISRSVSKANANPVQPICFSPIQSRRTLFDAVLELSDGTAYRGINFGAENKSVAGECVFQTGRAFSSHRFQRVLTGCV